MKRLIAILLILITALYVLPVSGGFMADTETSCKYLDNNTDDGKDTKNDNCKVFIAFTGFPVLLKSGTAVVTTLPVQSFLPVHFTVETPPPDQA
ncbi:MAG: hypothetical protein ACKOU7_05240 [Ferruginibacter sp.]